MDYSFKKLPVLSSPSGEAVWPRLQTPDTKFDNDGVYHTQLRVPADQAENFIGEIDQFLAGFKAHKEAEDGTQYRPGPLPYKHEMDKDGSPTGNVLFKFKLKAKAYNRKTGDSWDVKIPLYDKQAQAFTTDDTIGAGSKLKISCRFRPYANAAVGCGVSLGIEAVQVLEMAAYGGPASAQAFGFAPEEEDSADF
tara:strand:- start:3253 stop:3834 length:582 start_codon:yes stop_codon:yes gene_type:complete